MPTLEAGVHERVKLEDVLAADAHLGQEGIVFAMYWSVSTFAEWLLRDQGDQIEQSLQLVTLFLTICRWLHVYHQESSWLSHLRETDPGQS